jgi:biotin transport system substrate-specific component
MQATNTISDVFRPADRTCGLLYDAIIILCGSFVVALSAQVKFYLPFSPVPVTAQTFAVLVLGIALGSRRGAMTMVAYLAEGAFGLPVFTNAIGVAALFGPTGGYLVGFVVAAYLVGRLAEMGWDRRIITTIVAMIIGDAVLLAFGFVWLSILTDVKTALFTGFYPFVIGDVLKVMIAAAVLPAVWKLLGHFNLLRD